MKHWLTWAIIIGAVLAALWAAELATRVQFHGVEKTN